MSETLRRACDLFRLQPEEWKKLVETGMQQDWSWSRSAKKYVELYEKTLARIRGASQTGGAVPPN